LYPIVIGRDHVWSTGDPALKAGTVHAYKLLVVAIPQTSKP
jgi:hypothetical protein